MTLYKILLLRFVVLESYYGCFTISQVTRIKQQKLKSILILCFGGNRLQKQSGDLLDLLLKHLSPIDERTDIYSEYIKCFILVCSNTVEPL